MRRRRHPKHDRTSHAIAAEAMLVAAEWEARADRTAWTDANGNRVWLPHMAHIATITHNRAVWLSRRADAPISLARLGSSMAATDPAFGQACYRTIAAYHADQ